MRINWTMFPHTMPQTLTVGEEKRLMTEEMREANELIASIWADKVRLEEIFNRARQRYSEGSSR